MSHVLTMVRALLNAAVGSAMRTTSMNSSYFHQLYLVVQKKICAPWKTDSSLTDSSLLRMVSPIFQFQPLDWIRGDVSVSRQGYSSWGCSCMALASGWRAQQVLNTERIRKEICWEKSAWMQCIVFFLATFCRIDGSLGLAKTSYPEDVLSHLLAENRLHTHELSHV